MGRKKNSAGFYRRFHGETKYCGLPPPLDLTNPPTYRRVIQYIYFLINGGKDKDKIIGAVYSDVVSIWNSLRQQNLNPEEHTRYKSTLLRCNKHRMKLQGQRRFLRI